MGILNTLLVMSEICENLKKLSFNDAMSQIYAIWSELKEVHKAVCNK